MAPAVIEGKAPKTTAPVPGVVQGAAPVSPENTKSVSLTTTGNRTTTKETQPLVIPPDLNWSEPTKVITRSNTGFKPTQKGVVTYVEDGDTVQIKKDKDSKEAVNCRLDMVDAPEVSHKKGGKDQAYGQQSKKRLMDLVLNKEVSVNVSYATDEWGRNLCQIEVEGTDVSLKQIEDGMAWLYRKYGNPKEFQKASARAEGDRVGLFKDPNAIHPRNFKHN